jgi:hypothetical protein
MSASSVTRTGTTEPRFSNSGRRSAKSEAFDIRNLSGSAAFVRRPAISLSFISTPNLI